MEELEYDFNVHQSREADKNLAVRFYLHPLKNEEKSLEQKRPIFDDITFVEIRVRGDRNNIVMRPSRDDDKRRWPEALRAFESGNEIANSGTPLKEWPSMSASMLEELKHFGFHTVEQLAGASDSVCSKFAGLQSWKQKAIFFVEFASGQKPLDELQGRISASENETEVLRRNHADALAAIATLTAQVEALQGKKGK